jgi:hypothetical protein
MQYGKAKLTIEEVKEEHRKAKIAMARTTNPGFDPAQSDLITGEMEIALEHVLELTEQLFERYSRIGKNKWTLGLYGSVTAYFFTSLSSGAAFLDRDWMLGSED